MQTTFALKTQLKVSPQLILTGELLQVAGVDMEACILRELALNPALELVNTHDYAAQLQKETSPSHSELPGSSQSHSFRSLATGSPEVASDPLRNIATQLTAVEQLVAQVRLMVAPGYLELATFLLYSLDDHGYLRATPEELAAEFNVDSASVGHVVQILQQLEPPGIGAHDLQECLLIQCTHLEASGTDCRVARLMLTETWAAFVRQQWKSICHTLNVTTEEIDAARCLIFRHFYPYPLLLLEDSRPISGFRRDADLIIDKGVKKGDFNYTLEVPGAEAFELRVSASFEKALQAKLSAAERDWTGKAIERAHLFITSLKQRWATLRRIGEYLITYQADFLQRGPLYLKPLTRAMVARELGLHESTIGRAIHDKVAQLPNGRLIPLSQFFDDSLAVKEAIRQMLTQTNKSLSDREIASQLETQGFQLARRTITKYRQQLNILPVHQRHNQQASSGI